MTMTLGPLNRISGRDRLPDNAFYSAVLAACRECLAAGVYPVYTTLRKRGIHGANSRIIRARDRALVELGVIPPSPRVRAAMAHRVYIEGLKRQPKPERPKPKPDDPADDEGPCWRERRAFWVTEVGKRTRQLLLKPSHQEIQS